MLDDALHLEELGLILSRVIPTKIFYAGKYAVVSPVVTLHLLSASPSSQQIVTLRLNAISKI